MSLPFPQANPQIDSLDRRLKAHVRSKVDSRQDAEDIAQESWVRITAATRKSAASPVIENFGAYLFRVARNLVVDHHRRAAANPELKVDDLTLERVVDLRPDPESVLVTRTELQRMDRIMAAMPARPREVFRLSRIDGLSFAEIGRRLGTSRQAVHEHMVRALLAIQLAADTDLDARP